MFGVVVTTIAMTLLVYAVMAVLPVPGVLQAVTVIGAGLVIFPLIYFSQASVCGKCGAKELLPMDTPRGRSLRDCACADDAAERG